MSTINISNPTGRHFRELGIADWEVLDADPSEFAKTAHRKIAETFQPS